MSDLSGLIFVIFPSATFKSSSTFYLLLLHPLTLISPPPRQIVLLPIIAFPPSNIFLRQTFCTANFPQLSVKYCQCGGRCVVQW